ncbi:hypothetical protein ACFQZ8_25555, partial [Micromonospora azadirachtae]
AGDSAAPSNLPVRMSCQSAVQLGPQAAETVLSRIAGEPPADFNVGFFGECISLGRHAGIIQYAKKDDTPTGVFLHGGRPVAKMKEAVCKSTVWQLRQEARRPGAFNLWFKDRRRQESRRAQADQTPTLTDRAL